MVVPRQLLATQALLIKAFRKVLHEPRYPPRRHILWRAALPDHRVDNIALLGPDLVALHTDHRDQAREEGVDLHGDQAKDGLRKLSLSLGRLGFLAMGQVRPLH